MNPNPKLPEPTCGGGAMSPSPKAHVAAREAEYQPSEATKLWRTQYNKIYHRGYRAGQKLPNGNYAARAAEARERAETATSKTEKDALRCIAKSYDRLAASEDF